MNTPRESQARGGKEDESGLRFSVAQRRAGSAGILPAVGDEVPHVFPPLASSGPKDRGLASPGRQDAGAPSASLRDGRQGTCVPWPARCRRSQRVAARRRAQPRRSETEGIRIEELPNRDRVKPDAVGPLVKLPLGVHSKTGKFCALLDDAAEVLSDPFEAIRSLRRGLGARHRGLNDEHRQSHDHG